MFFLLLNILSTVGFLVAFRLFPRFKVDTFQAIVFNYVVCTTMAFIFVPSHLIASDYKLTAPWFPFAALLGVLFVTVFYITALTSQRVGLTAASVSSKMSMVVPVVVSIFILKTAKDFNYVNAIGLVVATLSVVLTSLKKKSIDKAKKASMAELIFLPLGVFLGSGAVDTFINLTSKFYLTSENNSILTLGIFSMAGIIGLTMLGVQYARGQRTFKVKHFVGGIALGVPNYFSIFFLLKALSQFDNDGATVYPISNIGVILASTLIGVLAFQERLRTINWLGVSLAVFAIVLLSVKGI